MNLVPCSFISLPSFLQELVKVDREPLEYYTLVVLVHKRVQESHNIARIIMIFFICKL